MSHEDELRSGLALLGGDPPPVHDRVEAVARRVRRRSQVRAAGGALAVAVVLGTLAVLGLPGSGEGRQTLPAGPAPSSAESGTEDFRVTITQAAVTAPGVTYDQLLQLVDQALAPLTLPGRTGRPLVDGAATGPVRVDFERALDGSERDRVRAALAAVPGAQVTVRDVAGFDLRLVAPLSDAVRAEVLARGAYVPAGVGPGALAEALRGLYGVEPDEQVRRLAVTYSGPALMPEELATARREVARLAGVPVERVRLERGSTVDSGFSYELGG